MDKELLQAKINDKITQLNVQIKQLEEMTQPVSPDVAIGRVSRIDAIQNKSVMEASLRNAKKKLEGLKFALQNIKDPDFGRCAKCKKMIPEGRILLMPESRFCVNCS